MKYTRRISNLSGQTPTSKHGRNLNVKFKSDLSALKYKKNNAEEQIDDMMDSEVEDDDINTKQSDLYKQHVEKMKRVNHIANKIRGAVSNDLDIDVKTTDGSGTKFRDSFGQGLNVPCIPTQNEDGNLNQCKEIKSAYRSIANNQNVIDDDDLNIRTNANEGTKKDGFITRKDRYGNIISNEINQDHNNNNNQNIERNQQRRVANAENNDDSKRDGYITRKDVNGNIISNQRDTSNNYNSGITYVKNTNEGQKWDGFITRKDKSGSTTIIDKDGTRIIRNKEDEENNQNNAEDNDSGVPQEYSFDSSDNEFRTKNTHQADTPPLSPVFSAQDDKTTMKSYSDINIRPYNSNYGNTDVDNYQSDPDMVDIEDQEHELLENDHPEEYDQENRQDYMNKIRRDQIQELAKIKKRSKIREKNDNNREDWLKYLKPDDRNDQLLWQKKHAMFNRNHMNDQKEQSDDLDEQLLWQKKHAMLNRKEYTELEKLKKRAELDKKQESHVNQANSFNPNQSKKINDDTNALPSNKHLEYTDVHKKTDTNGNIVTQIFDTVIDEQIFQSESGVIKRKFYKRVIKSSPTKSPNSPNLIPSSTQIDNLSPGGRSFTVETPPKKKTSNLVSQLNDFRLPSSPTGKQSPMTNNSPTSSKLIDVESVHMSPRGRISPTSIKDKHISPGQKDDEIDSENIEELMDIVKTELNEKSKNFEFFKESHTKKLRELELLVEQRLKDKEKIQFDEMNDKPEKIQTPTKEKYSYSDQDHQIASRRREKLTPKSKFKDRMNDLDGKYKDKLDIIKQKDRLNRKINRGSISRD